jgi:hypothetical protein
LTLYLRKKSLFYESNNFMKYSLYFMVIWTRQCLFVFPRHLLVINYTTIHKTVLTDRYW